MAYCLHISFKTMRMKKRILTAAIAAAATGIGVATWMVIKKRRGNINEREAHSKMSANPHHLTNAFSHAKNRTNGKTVAEV